MSKAIGQSALDNGLILARDVIERWDIVTADDPVFQSSIRRAQKLLLPHSCHGKKGHREAALCMGEISMRLGAHAFASAGDQVTQKVRNKGNKLLKKAEAYFESVISWPNALSDDMTAKAQYGLANTINLDQGYNGTDREEQVVDLLEASASGGCVGAKVLLLGIEIFTDDVPFSLTKTLRLFDEVEADVLSVPPKLQPLYEEMKKSLDHVRPATKSLGIVLSSQATC